MNVVSGSGFLSLQTYQPPQWLSQTIPSAILPQNKVTLGRFPTPVHKWSVPGLEELDVFIKRDDLSSFDLSGNKVRKLEFLMAEAIKGKHDCVITAGGVQSNHCRATAVAARQLGIDPYLILRTTTRSTDSQVEELGLTGNLLLDRLVGANIRTVTLSQYVQYGQELLLSQLADQLKEEGRNPYIIPVGGSNTLGAFGYTECIQEIIAEQTVEGKLFDHIVFGCGSGGTAAGLALGMLLSGLSKTTHLHGVGVCDSPKYFYDHITEVAKSIGVFSNDDNAPYNENSIKEFCHIYPGQGIGYAKSTTEELQYITGLSQQTGIILDPVYSGKAMYHFVEKVVKGDSAARELIQPGQRILFIHTGGTLGLYDKVGEVLPLLPADQVQKMTVKPPPKLLI